MMEFYSQDLNIVTTVDSLFSPPKLEMQLQRFGQVPFRCVGPLVNQKGPRISNVEIKEQPLPWDQIDTSKPLVFLSLGTVANSHFWTNKFGHQASSNGVQDLTGKEFIQLVFRTAFEAFEDEEVFVVMALGPKEDALEGLEKQPPQNFLLQKSVPQLEVLAKCQAFVTHGGANSMHEALGFGVPMAVVPIFGDQPSNAEAVAKAGCGVSFKEPLKTLSPQSLRAAVRQLIAPDSAFLASCAKLRKQMVQAGGAGKAAELVLAAGCAPSSKLGGA